MKKVLSIVGPTAVGKTSLGLVLASKFNGEIISADAVQVYKDLDIISGKDLPKGAKPKFDSNLNTNVYDFNSIPVYLLDVVLPTYNFNVSDFAKNARPVLEYILDKNKLPVVVGGTGFYVSALFGEIKSINVPRNESLRNELNNKTTNELQEILKEKNIEKFNSMNNSDRNNPRRLIRAIEITIKIHDSGFKIKDSKRECDVLFIGLKCERDELKKRIDKRIDERIKAGALEEAKSLFKQYEKLSSNVKTTNGYRQLFEYLKGEITLENAVEKWRISEYLHAKNQMTWFNKDKRIRWFDINEKDFYIKITEFINSWYNITNGKKKN